MAPSSAAGVVILKGNKPKWRVGKKLGSGACATVYSLEGTDRTSTEWAIKLSPLPTKITKKKNSEIEVNATKLYYEHVVYRNQFQDILGEYVPKLPPYGKGPPSCGEAGGFRFLILEKMEHGLDKVVPLLLNAEKAGTINFGPIAIQLLACVRAIQERKHVVVDIKPENFMLATGKGGVGTNATQKLASRIRLLDLALVQPWSSIGSHRANEGISGMAGTPLYASINVHNGETPSRRDDLESLGYVIAELLIKLVARDESKELPWSHGRSDEEIGEMKLAFIEDRKSDFYKQLGGGGATVANVVAEYLNTVRAYTFKKKPDYDSLEQILSKLKVSMGSTTKKKTTKTTTRVKRTTTTTTSASSKRVTRSKKRAASSETNDDESPNKTPRNERFMDCDIIELSDDDTEEEGTPMDWEPTDENKQPAIDSKPKALKRRGVKLVVTEGPHKGEVHILERGKTESYTIGSKPSSKTGGLVALKRDKRLKASHLTLTLSVTKKLVTVVITDKSKGGTQVNRDTVNKGKAFINDMITIGDSVLEIKSL